MARRYSEHEIDAAVEAAQIARLHARQHDPSWRLAEATDGLGGLVWQQIQEEEWGPDSATQMLERGPR
jgi:hypothetical protein